MKHLKLWGMLIIAMIMFSFTVTSAQNNAVKDSTESMKTMKHVKKMEPMHHEHKMMMKMKRMGTFMAKINGDQVVPPVNTKASGHAVFWFSKDGKKLYYKLFVSNIDSVSMAHIHHAAPGKNGPIAVWLYKGKITGEVNGLLAKGTITNKDIDLKKLKKWMENGDTYVMVHTVKHPNGEIRGLIKK